MAEPNVIALVPERGHPALEGDYFARGPQVFFEEIGRKLERVEGLADGTFTSITSSDSPYTASDNEFIHCDMDGNITVVLPASGRVYVSRDGASNTLTIQGTVNDTVNPTIAFDGTGVAMAYMATEWRFI